MSVLYLEIEELKLGVRMGDRQRLGLGRPSVSLDPHPLCSTRARTVAWAYEARINRKEG